MHLLRAKILMLFKIVGDSTAIFLIIIFFTKMYRIYDSNVIFQEQKVGF